MGYNYSERRTVALLLETLAPAIALNVLSHLAISIGAHAEPGMMGRPTLLDASGVPHLGISRYPVIIKRATSADIRRVVTDARQMTDVLLADYPSQMLSTGHDDELAAALRTVPADALEYLGALLYGPTLSVDSLYRTFSLWR